jgi:hypothetical protein
MVTERTRPGRPRGSAGQGIDPSTLDYVDLRDKRDDGLLAALHAHDGLYRRSFPPEEREDQETHRDALWKAGPCEGPVLHVIVARPPGKPRTILGFVAAEYYPRSSCGLISYLAVERDARRHGLGRALVDRALLALRTDSRTPGPVDAMKWLEDGEEASGLRAVFGEIHDPARGDDPGDSMRTLDRIRFMHELGARRLPIPYVQPALTRTGRKARRLMLVAFPLDGGPVETVEPGLVRAFLDELYRSLGVEDPPGDVDFVRSLVGLRGDAPLELAGLITDEAPTFRDPESDETARDVQRPLAVYGIAMHLVLEPEQRSWLRRRLGRSRVGAHRDPPAADPLRSFEQDILAYADPYQPAPETRAEVTPSAPPFSSYAREVPADWAMLSATFPSEVAFRSEGRLVPLRCFEPDQEDGGRTRRFLLRAVRTDFRRSGLSVLHLVLGPDPGDPAASALNEYDLIKLMKLWQPGEGLERKGVDAAAGSFVTFHAGRDGERRELEQLTGSEALHYLAANVFGLASPARAIDGPRAGTVQVLHGCCRRTTAWGPRNICGEMDEVVEREGAIDPSNRLKAVGGLVCALLDFAEIDGDELADVFRQVRHDDQALRSFHKATLLVASPGDRAFDAEGIRVSVGLSPYLLVPHAVLVHNEWLLRDAVRRLDVALHRRRWTTLGRLERARTYVAETLSARLVPNVFNYNDERTLFETGARARGLDQRELVVRRRLEDELNARIEARHKNRDTMIATLLAALLVVLAINDTVDKLHEGWLKDHRYWFTIGLALLGAMTLAWLLLRRERSPGGSD